MPKEEELETMTATPFSIEYEGENYELSPLNLASMSKLRKWAKAKIIEEAKDSVKLIGNDVPKEVVDSIWRDVSAQLRDPLTSDVMSNPETIAEWTRLSLCETKPDMNTEKATAIMSSTKLRDLLKILMDLNGVVEGGDVNPPVAVVKQ